MFAGWCVLIKSSSTNPPIRALYYLHTHFGIKKKYIKHSTLKLENKNEKNMKYEKFYIK